MKNLIFILLLLSKSSFSQPVITSISPASVPIGATVLITGTNFSNIANNNIVYFGAVRAVVTDATTTSLSVIVPAGALYKPITVTTDGLTAYSPIPFLVTSNSNSLIDVNSFAAKTDFSAGTHPISVAVGDLNSDGKPDVVTANNVSNSISIFRNTGTNGQILFASKQDIGTPNYPQSVSVSDIDGDGMLDILVTNSSTDQISIFRNTSENGTITFAEGLHYPTGADPNDVGVADFDGDGKSDLAVVNYNSHSISVFKNIGSVGNILFANKDDFSTGNLLPWSIALGDIDNDGMTDMVVSDYTPFYDSISVFRNTSVNGTISFNNKVDFPKARGALGVSISDIDGDNKQDIIAACWGSNKISVLRNIGSTTNISFAPRVDYSTGSYPESICITDMDGDGKPDIGVGNYISNTVSLFKNISTSGTISFKSKIDFPTGTNPHGLSFADLNGDGRPDIITANLNSDNISILRNTMTSVAQICPNANTTLTSSFTGTNYQWQRTTDLVNFEDISDNSTYSGSSGSILTINNITSSLYGYYYRCIVEGRPDNLFEIKFINRWTGLIDNSWENTGNWSCGTLPDAYTDVIINSGTITLSSVVNVRSLLLSPNASITLNAGAILNVVH